MRGKTTRSLTVGSATRSYIAYLPQSASATTAMPFVYVFHGANQDGSELFDITQYSTLADSEGIAVVFPDGQGTTSATSTTALNPWSVSDNGAAVCGAGSLVSNPNAVDFAFMDAIKADVTQDQCLDASTRSPPASRWAATSRTTSRAIARTSGRPRRTRAARSRASPRARRRTSRSSSSTAPRTRSSPPAATTRTAPRRRLPASATLWAQKNGCKSTYTTIAGERLRRQRRAVLPLRRLSRRRAGRALYVHEHEPRVGGLDASVPAASVRARAT